MRTKRAFNETNPYVLSGEYVRVYVCEVEVGDVLIDGLTVTAAIPGSNRSTYLYTDGDDYGVCYGNPLSTILVRA